MFRETDIRHTKKEKEKENRQAQAGAKTETETETETETGTEEKAERGEKKSMIQISFRVPRAMKALAEKCVRCDMHASLSSFFRDALREKIIREAPQLYQQLFQEAAT